MFTAVIYKICIMVVAREIITRKKNRQKKISLKSVTEFLKVIKLKIVRE
jgi:hypothetical protein